MVARQQEQFGGIKPGSAFFGWLTATGTAVLLAALVSAAGVALGLATDTTVDKAASAATADSKTVGITGAIVLAVILFIAYFCGGYVAGRMARFNGAKQGLAVWLWAALIAGLVALAAVIAGNKYDVLSTREHLPEDPGRLGHPHHRRGHRPDRGRPRRPARRHSRWHHRDALPPPHR